MAQDGDNAGPDEGAPQEPPTDPAPEQPAPPPHHPGQPHPGPQQNYAPQQPGQQHPPSYYPPQQYPPQPIHYVQMPVAVAPPNADGAVASMVLGIVSMFLCCFGWITGIIAVVLGAKAMKQIADSGGRYGGRGMAITGLVLGIISLVIYLPYMILVFAGAVTAPLAG